MPVRSTGHHLRERTKNQEEIWPNPTKSMTFFFLIGFSMSVFVLSAKSALVPVKSFSRGKKAEETPFCLLVYFLLGFFVLIYGYGDQRGEYHVFLEGLWFCLLGMEGEEGRMKKKKNGRGERAGLMV